MRTTSLVRPSAGLRQQHACVSRSSRASHGRMEPGLVAVVKVAWLVICVLLVVVLVCLIVACGHSWVRLVAIGLLLCLVRNRRWLLLCDGCVW